MKSRIMYLWPVFAIPLLVVLHLACRKSSESDHTIPQVTGEDALIGEARTHLEQNDFLGAVGDDSNSVPGYHIIAPKGLLDGSGGIDSLSDVQITIRKKPMWGKAEVEKLKLGDVVVVPMKVEEIWSTQIGKSRHVITASRFSWLMMYKDYIDQRWHVEVLTSIPDGEAPVASSRSGSASFSGSPGTPLIPFAGKIRVEDWYGHFIKGFLYQKDGIVPLTVSRMFKKVNVPAVGDARLAAAVWMLHPYPASLPFTGSTPARPSVETLLINPDAPNAPTLETCSETDWYACTTIADGPTECTYAYTTEECSVSASGTTAVGPDVPGGPTAVDYAFISSSGASFAGEVQSIIPDTSITNHPIVLCVYNHLMSNQLQYGLQSILAAFAGNQVYNVTFSVVPDLGVDGMTTYLGNNNFLIKLNQSDADDPDYSRIYLASTFIHEAFHAKLRQKALAVFGNAAISQWPQPIDDMTLNELLNYFEVESKAANIWESVTHDWMVENIDDMATSLEDFVQTFYKSTYASVGSNIAPYEALMYMGLSGSVFYQEEVVDKGLEPSIEKYWGDFNDGGKCDN